MNIPLPKHPIVLVQQMQQLDGEKCRDSNDTDTGYRIPHQKGVLGVTMLCSPESQCQQGQAFVKNINIAKMYEGDLYFCRKGGVICPLCLSCCLVQPGALQLVQALV